MGVLLSLKGASIANNGYVDVDDIGEDNNALLCHSNKTYCCDIKSVNRPEDRAGEWHFSCNESINMGIGILRQRTNAFYRKRGPSTVLLNRRGNPSQRGCFRCEVPDANDVSQIIFVNIGMFFSTYQ